MLKIWMKTGLAIFSLCLVQSIFAQKSTEMFIPLGQSPGLSGEYTRLGEIDAVNIQNKTLSMSDSAGSYTLKITDRTQLWLDQSQLKLKNMTASMQDIRKGMQAEVKYMKNEQGGAVEWIKIQLVE